MSADAEPLRDAIARVEAARAKSLARLRAARTAFAVESTDLAPLFYYSSTGDADVDA